VAGFWYNLFMIKKENGYELSYDTKTLITVILLVTVYPVGLILMFAWMRWDKWIKILILLPFLLAVLVPILILIMAGSLLFRVGDNLSRPETIREIREMIITPTSVMVTPTVKMIKK